MRIHTSQGLYWDVNTYTYAIECFSMLPDEFKSLIVETWTEFLMFGTDLCFFLHALSSMKVYPPIPKTHTSTLNGEKANEL